MRKFCTVSGASAGPFRSSKRIVPKSVVSVAIGRFATVGMAMGSGTDVALATADVSLLGGSVSLIADALELARRTYRVIRQNLAWAFLYNVVMVPLAIFGFLTLGAHAGYAVYFPELFPTRLRGTGAGFCFNVGRLTAAPVLFLSGWFQDLGLTLSDVASLLSLLFLAAAGLLAFAPETKGKHLE